MVLKKLVLSQISLPDHWQSVPLQTQRLLLFSIYHFVLHKLGLLVFAVYVIPQPKLLNTDKCRVACCSLSYIFFGNYGYWFVFLVYNLFLYIFKTKSTCDFAHSIYFIKLLQHVL